jgi:uncharacterized protein YdeI (YjbR/CyaY-like superfamily)
MTVKEKAVKMPHTLPADFRKAISSNKRAKSVWDDISPLAKNEWICWVISGAKAETRGIRIDKALSKMSGGMRRPCCWVGCTHRNDKPMSSAQKWVFNRKK